MHTCRLKLLTYAVLAGLLIGTSCTTKKPVVSSKKRKARVSKKVAKRTEKRKLYKTADDPYPLPEDTGKFMHFTIQSTEDYIITFADIAMKEMRAYGIPASITLAQGVLESGSGQSDLVRRSNNHFGIKCHSGWLGPFVRHDDDARQECFRKYNHPMYSFRDHSLFLSKRNRYKFLFSYRKDNYKGWAKGLKEAGYATDRKYPAKLIALIEKYELYKYDREVLREGYVVKARAPKPVYFSHTVQKGETLYGISRKYGTSVNDIKNLNALNNNSIDIGQVLIIKKLSKG